MKNRLFLTLLCLTIVLPGFAQQTNSNTSSASSGQTASSPQKTDASLDPLPSQAPTDFWDGDDPNLANLLAHPFASKKYVQRHTRPIKDRLNELDQITSETSQMTKDVDARAQRGIQMASEKTSLADQHASDAASKAQLAQTAATQASTRVASAEQVVGNLDQYKGTGQTEIRFRPGQSVLSKSAKDALDEMATPLKDQRSYIIEVRGFSSGHGQAAIAASQKMADSVVRYLVLSHNIPVYRIYVLGMGSAAASGGGAGSKVEVSVMKNDMVSSAQR